MRILACKQFGPEGSALLDAIGPNNPYAFETFSWMDDDDKGVSAGIMIKADKEWFSVLVNRIGIHIANCRLKDDYVTDIVKISKEERTIFIRTSVLY